MTVEEKAKAYDIIVQRVTELYETGTTLTKEQMEHLFPELRESEDERIRKELIEFIKWSVDRHFMREDFHQAKRPSEWIAYLEKQKEQKSIESVAAEITKDKESAIKFLKSAGIMDDNGELAEMYRSEQKSAIWTEEACEAAIKHCLEI